MLSLALATVVSVNGTLVEAKRCTFTLESTHFIFNKCPIYTHDGASAKFSTTSHEADYSVITVGGIRQEPVIPRMALDGMIPRLYDMNGIF